MSDLEQFVREHGELTRRYFLRLGVAGSALAGMWPRRSSAAAPAPELAAAIAALESFFTPPANFRDVSRGKPLPHSLPDEKKTRSRPDARDLEAGSRSPIPRIRPSSAAS